jgi:hypothetical protein
VEELAERLTNTEIRATVMRYGVAEAQVALDDVQPDLQEGLAAVEAQEAAAREELRRALSGVVTGVGNRLRKTGVQQAKRGVGSNPPYSRWNDYAKLVVEAKAEVVCLLLDWGQECLPTLLDRSVLKGYIPAGAAIFEISNGVRCPPTKWGMWLLVPGRVRQLQPPTRR